MSSFMDNLNDMQDWEPGKSFNDEPERHEEPSIDTLPETISMKDWIEMANIDIVGEANSYAPWQGEVRITSEIRPDALFTSNLTFGMNDPDNEDQWGGVLSIFHRDWRDLWFLDDYYDSLTHYYMEEGLTQDYSTAKQWQRTIEEQWEDFQEQFGEYLSEAFKRVDHRYGLFEYIKRDTTDFIPIFSVIPPHDIDGTYYIGSDGQRYHVDEDWHCVYARLEVENLNNGKYYPRITLRHISWRRDENDLGMSTRVNFDKDRDGHFNNWFRHQDPYEQTWGSGQSYSVSSKYAYRVWTPQQLEMFAVFSGLQGQDINGDKQYPSAGDSAGSSVVWAALNKYTGPPWDRAIRSFYMHLNGLQFPPTPNTANKLLVKAKLDVTE